VAFDDGAGRAKADHADALLDRGAALEALARSEAVEEL